MWNAVADRVRANALDGIGRDVERLRFRTRARQAQCEAAVVAETVKQPSARVASRRLAVLALIEKEAGLLSLPKVDVVFDGSLANEDRIGNLAVKDVDALRQPLERPHLRIVPREDAGGLQQVDENQRDGR